MMDSSASNSSRLVDSRYDDALMQIFNAEDKSLGKFFDSVFGFFCRLSPDILYDDSKHYGRQVLISQYEKWQKHYQSFKRSENSPKKIENHSKSKLEHGSESIETDSWENTLNQGKGLTHTTNTATVSRRIHDETVIVESKKNYKTNEGKKCTFDVTNGAELDSYAWSQSSGDIEVRIPVHESVKKGNQVKVDIGRKSLRVQGPSYSSGGFTDILIGELSWSVKCDECVWFLSPGQHLSILLEKSESKWWDRLLLSEDPIDLNKINSERSLSSLPEDERMQIEKAVVDHQREREGKLTSDQEKMAAMLEKAWDVEGSPFKGQPFDPSIVKTMTNCSSGGAV